MANLKFHNSQTGQWEEIKVSTRLKDLYHTTKLTQDQNYVDIGVTNFNPNEDVVFSICNSTWLQRDDDYIVNDGLLRIESKDGTNWKNGDTFNFVVLKNVDKDALPSADGSLIQDGSITIAKLAVTLQTAINKVGITALTTTATALSDAINELNTSLSDKANDTDENRTTTSKNVTGAINELNTNKVNKTDFTNLLSANGWRKLPDGTIEQWGSASITSGSAINFPITFPNYCFGVSAIAITGTPSKVSLGISTTSNTVINHDYGSAVGIYWRAIGK